MGGADKMLRRPWHSNLIFIIFKIKGKNIKVEKGV
jgi:hypothetical protein